MPQYDDVGLHREEVRGLFVLGVIATLLAIRDSLNFRLVAWGFSGRDLTDVLIAFWGLYAFLMAIGVSGDLVRRGVARIAIVVARLMFSYGLGVFVMIIAMLPLQFIFLAMFGEQYGPTISAMIGIVIAFSVGAALGAPPEKNSHPNRTRKHKLG